MAEKLKDMYFQEVFLENLSVEIKKVFPEFDSNMFRDEVLNDTWKDKELKAKMRHISVCLNQFLPAEYPAAIKILKQTAPHFKGFDAMVFPDFVECYGLEYWDISMDALELFTKSCSSEWAVRPFLTKDPQAGMEIMSGWAEDGDEHLRRLASEGCRPRLPWAGALPAFKKDPAQILPILEKLKNDPSEYVRRSVANNLNDISKDNPDIALTVFESWYGRTKETDRIVKHAARDLLKKGNKRALKLFGFADPENIETGKIQIDNGEISIGQCLNFWFELKVNTPQASKLRLEYALYYVKSNAKISRKIFQLKEAWYEPGKYTVKRKLSLQDLSTRKHYPGEHFIAVIVNGREQDRTPFSVTAGKNTC